MLLNLVAFSPLLSIALVAQWSNRYQPVRWLVYGLLLLLIGMVALGGISLITIGQSPEARQIIADQLPGMTVTRWTTAGVLALSAALLALIPLVPNARRGLAHLIPIDSDSTIHTTALSLAALVSMGNLAQMPLVGGLETLAGSSAQISFGMLLTSSLPVGLLALIGVGLFIRRSAGETWERLGIERLTWSQVGLAAGLTVAILAFYYGVDWVWRAAAPQNYRMMEQLGDVLFGGLSTNWWQAMIVSLSAGVSEELFFRGAVQKRFGFWLTAVIFTIIHVQYGFSVATLEVLGAALMLGWLRERTNTTTCILVHILYNAVGLIVFPLLP